MRLTKKYRYMVISISLSILLILATVSYAWIVLINKTDSFIVTAAQVDVSYAIYIDGSYTEPDFFTYNPNNPNSKIGVFRINVSDTEANDYINNLRIDIRVNSTVDTYLRVKLIDALTLATLDFDGNYGEVSIVDQPINYAFNRYWIVNDLFYENLIDAEIALGGITSNDDVEPFDYWYDNRLWDEYYYYPEKIEREMTSGQLTIPFIEAYDGDEFKTKSIGYSLQIAILVEGIQAGNDAPIINWGLDTPPWGGEW